mmetsp:Transcript_33307/g.77987  ORF Transcript_33307/g.77987 Transcript_33307/m.77987 type:complete len:495 (+) Transcript_33307:230-1714(+)
MGGSPAPVEVPPGYEGIAPPPGDEEEGGQGFKKVLTALDLTMIGVGSIVGSGIFVMSGQAAALYAGPAVVVSFAISGLACIVYAMSFAELAAAYPTAGSAYSYTKVAFGRFPSWIVGWALVSEYMFGISVITVGWSGYFCALMRHIGWGLPKSISTPPLNFDSGHIPSLSGSYVNLPAVILILLVSVVVVIGARESASSVTAMVLVKVTVIVMFVLFGIGYIDTENWDPFVPEPADGTFGEFGWSGVLRASSVIFFAYVGFDAVTTGAGECIHPQRDLPIAIFSSLGIVTLLYCSTSLVLTGMLHYSKLMVPDPLSVAVDAHDGLRWLSPILACAVVVGLPSGVLCGVYSMSRIFYIMAEDMLLPTPFRDLHPAFRTPYLATIICGLCAAVLAGSLPVNVIGELCSMGTLLAFGTVSYAVIRLRETDPDVPRPFKVPFCPYLPAAGVLLALAQTLFLPFVTWVRMGVWLLAGVGIYLWYGAQGGKGDAYERIWK